jgi:hypothetical protein
MIYDKICEFVCGDNYKACTKDKSKCGDYLEEQGERISFKQQANADWENIKKTYGIKTQDLTRHFEENIELMDEKDIGGKK